VKRPFVKDQPKHGDQVLTCGHEERQGQHFWKCPGMVAAGPDGPVPVDWLTACDACALAATYNPHKIAWVNLATWQGDKPEVKTWP